MHIITNVLLEQNNKLIVLIYKDYHGYWEHNIYFNGYVIQERCIDDAKTVNFIPVTYKIIGLQDNKNTIGGKGSVYAPAF